MKSLSKEVVVDDLVIPLIGSIALVTIQNINVALSPLDLTCNEFQQHTETNGVINSIFFLNTTTTKGENRDLVLRLGNCHPWWKEVKLVSEVSVMSYISKHFPHIPIAKIITYHTDASTSVFGSEYLIMEKVSGVPLSELEEDLTDDQKKTIAKQLVRYVGDLMTVKFDKIGAFDSSFNSSVTIHDGPPLGPFPDIISACKGYINWTLDIIRFHPYLKHLQSTLETPLTAFLSKIDSLYTPRPEDTDIVLCHLDLHPGNVLVNPGTLSITAILDWEKSGTMPWWLDWTHIRLFWDGDLAEFMDEELFLVTGKRYVPSEEEEEAPTRLDALIAMDVIHYCCWTQFWCATWYLKEEKISEDKVDSLREKVKKGIEHDIADHSNHLLTLLKALNACE